MLAFWNRLPRWADWVVAVAAGIVLLNLNVTAAGDPLSSVGGGSASTGISDETKTVVYATIMIGSLILTGIGVVVATRPAGRPAAGRLMSTTYPLVALSGLAGLLLDYRDGPVRTVQLVVYVMIAFGAVRLARTVALVNDPS